MFRDKKVFVSIKEYVTRTLFIHVNLLRYDESLEFHLIESFSLLIYNRCQLICSEIPHVTCRLWTLVDVYRGNRM